MTLAELLIRVGMQDAALIRRLLAAPGPRPHRIVVDAHVALTVPSIAGAARAAGVPFVVDPQTHFLQDAQHSADPWAQLPFADSRAATPPKLLNREHLAALVAGVVEHQVTAGATALVAPYVHVNSTHDGWAEVQIALWRATRLHLDQQRLRLPLIPVLALGWRLLDRSAWAGALDPLVHAIRDLGASEVAFAASKIDAGTKPEDRLESFIAVLRRLRQEYPVIAWQQGTLGLAAVAAGAAGYECGIGWRERCDLRAAMCAHRRAVGHRGGPRPVYIASLQRSIPKASVRALLANHKIIADLVCLDGSCCPGGRASLVGDARAHAVRTRLRGLECLTQPAQPAWSWHYLAQEAAAGIDLVRRINALADSTRGLLRVDDAALRATFTVGEHRRQTLRRRRAA